ncbi:hypothetical protein Tco_0235063, partial [Tanacetum coccineum]
HFDVLYSLGHMVRPLDFFYVIHVDLIIGSRCLIPAFHLVLLGRYKFPHHLNSMQQLDLEAEVSNEEIKKAVWDCGVDKSPGPDGFTFGFYKSVDSEDSRSKNGEGFQTD